MGETIEEMIIISDLVFSISGQSWPCNFDESIQLFFIKLDVELVTVRDKKHLIDLIDIVFQAC
jgi:hypothetical protein